MRQAERVSGVRLLGRDHATPRPLVGGRSAREHDGDDETVPIHDRRPHIEIEAAVGLVPGLDEAFIRNHFILADEELRTWLKGRAAVTDDRPTVEFPLKRLLGREPKGSVAPGREYEEVRDAIARRLEALVDPETGERPVVRVYRREEIYSGFDPRVVPDLRAANGAHYRIGWQTALGEVPPRVFEDNLKAWSGDHCSNDPSLVPGVLFSNVKLARSDPGIADIYPTVLALLGVPPVEGIDGRTLLP